MKQRTPPLKRTPPTLPASRRKPGLCRAAAILAAAMPLWLGSLPPASLPLAAAGIGALGLALAPPARAQGLGSGKEGEGLHNETGQGGGGLGASGSGPQGSGAQGDTHAGPSKDAAPSSARNGDGDNDAVTNKDVQRLYTPPPQDAATPADTNKPAR